MTLVLTPSLQRNAALALAVLAAALILMVLVLPAWSAAALQNERVGMLQRQARSLEGLVEVAPRYEALARSLAARADGRSLVMVAANSGLGVAELQSQLTRILRNEGIAVTASQPLTEEAADGLTKIAVSATLEVEIGPLVKALHQIGAARPLLKVERVSLHEPDADFAGLGAEPNMPNKLIAEIVVSAYMREP